MAEVRARSLNLPLGLRRCGSTSRLKKKEKSRHDGRDKEGEESERRNLAGSG